MEMQRLNEMEEKRRKYMESSKYRKQENSNNIQSFLSGMVNLFKPKWRNSGLIIIYIYINYNNTKLIN